MDLPIVWKIPVVQMRPPEHYEVGPYSTDRARLLSGDDWWDGHNYERNGGVNEWLYQSDDGQFFTIRLRASGKISLHPMRKEDAHRLYVLHRTAAEIYGSGNIRVPIEDVYPEDA